MPEQSLSFSDLGLTKKLKDTVSPPEPVQSDRKRLEVPVAKYGFKITDAIKSLGGAKDVNKQTFDCVEHTQAVFAHEAESIIQFYVHDIPPTPENKVGDTDLILIGGGASEAYSNLGFAALLDAIFAKKPELQGKFSRIIVLPHLASQAKTKEPSNPARTPSLAPAAEIMAQALKQAGIRLSENICLAGFSAGANQAIQLADQLPPEHSIKLVLIEPAIGPNPKITNRAAIADVTDNMYANKNGIRPALDVSLQGWVTPEGPAKNIRGFIKALFAGNRYVRDFAREAGIDKKELAGNKLNAQAVQNDSSESARLNLINRGKPVIEGGEIIKEGKPIKAVLAWVEGARTVGPVFEGDEETKLLNLFKPPSSKPDEANYLQTARKLFPNIPEDSLAVTLMSKEKSHSGGMWDIEGLTDAFSKAMS